MNEIKKCSIAGVSFTFEEDAYQTLNDYIESLQRSYEGDPDGEEIIADIEARIAELILSAQPANAIVCQPLVRNIIKQMGSAEEIDEEKSDNSSSQTIRDSESTDRNGNPRFPRRLYRDLQNRKLGGVCAGLANYFAWDVTWVRLLFALPLVVAIFGSINLFGIHIMLPNISLLVGIGYLIMWFTIPAASSARQKLEMNGERVTAHNIRQATQAQAADATERTILANIVIIFGKILLIILKIIAAFILVGLVVGAGVLTLVALGAIPMLAFDMTTGLALMSFFAVIITPVCVLIYLTIALLISRRPNGKAILIIFLLWLASLVTMTVSAIKSSADFANSIENAFDSVFEHDKDILFKEFSEDEINEFRKQIGEEPFTFTTATTSTSYTLGQNTASTHYNNGMQISFCGSPEVVKYADDNLELDTDKGEIHLKTSSGHRATITQNGIKGSRVGFDIEREALGVEFSEYAFTLPDGLKVHCLIGPAIQNDIITKEVLEGIFGVTGGVFSIANGVLKTAGNILNLAGGIIQIAAPADIESAREDIRKAQEDIREAQKEMQDAIKETHKEIREAQKEMRKEIEKINE